MLLLLTIIVAIYTAKCQSDYESLKTSVMELRAELKAVQNTLQANTVKHEEKVADLENKVTWLKHELNQNKRKLNDFHKNGTGSILFAAELSTSMGPSAMHSIIPYGRVISNLGSAYSPGTYTFTALHHGYYLFQWSIMSESSQYRSCSYLSKDSQPINGFGSWGGFDSMGLQMGLLELKVGEQINVRVGDYSFCRAWYSEANIIHRSSTFKGFLVRNLEL